MTPSLRGWSISARLFAMQFAFILALTGVATALLWADARTDVEADASQRCFAVATAIAVSPFVKEALALDDPSSELQPYAVDIMSTTATDFVTVMAPDRTRFTHPDLTQLGKPFIGTIAPALAGKSFTETYTGTLGPSVRAVVPVTDDGGEVIGLVAVGVKVSNVAVALGGRLPIVFGAAGVTLLLGGLASWLLSRYLRRVTWGRGPEEIGRMFSYYEGVLHSVREGLVVVDPQRRLVLYNDQAAELLRLPFTRPAGPIAVENLELPDALKQLLGSGERVVDEVYLTDERVLVVNQEVAVSTGSSRPARVLGTVTTLRDHTDLQQLAGELQTMRTLSTALRSQTHEFSNRLHTIVALIELDRPEAALEFAANEIETSQDLADQLIGSINEPVLAALLLGKSAQANERGIELRFTIDPELGALEIPANDVVTIIGNLLDNAMDAVGLELDPARAATVEPPSVSLEVHRVVSTTAVSDAALSDAAPSDAAGGEVVIRVRDNGPGVLDVDRIFQRGYTTKASPEQFNQGGGRGVGLALVGQSVRRLGGTITVESDAGAVFTIRIPRPTGASAPVPPPATLKTTDIPSDSPRAGKNPALSSGPRRAGQAPR